MRPVERGPSPRQYADYHDAGSDLQQCLDHYCSYCERHIETHLAVEHIKPKSSNQALCTTWSNFLLSCVNCNSCKGETDVVLRDYLWPDNDNTLLAYSYTQGGRIKPNSNLPNQLQVKAQATLELLGLDKYPGNTGREPTKSDNRWIKRFELWQIAEKDLHRLVVNDNVELRETIVENALGRGGFSIWWTIFEGDADMRRRLREAFHGTAPDCFDEHEHLVNRPGGQV